LQDPSITRAPAEVPGDRLAQLEVVGGGVAVEQVMDRHHEARRAETALHGALVEKGALYVGEPTVAAIEPFDGRHLPALRVGRQHETRADQPVIEAHRARPALPLLARVLRPGQAQPLAQHIEQALAEPGSLDDPRGTVDGQLIGLGFRHRLPFAVSTSA
jgi:hypothetical protein